METCGETFHSKGCCLKGINALRGMETVLYGAQPSYYHSRLKGINALRGMETIMSLSILRKPSWMRGLKGINALRGMETNPWRQ